MSDPKCGRALLEAAGRNILTLKGLGPGHEPINRLAALASHARDRLAEVE